MSRKSVAPAADQLYKILRNQFSLQEFRPGQQEIVEAVAPKPVNVLLLPGMQARDLFELGVCRVSTGSFLTDAAWRALESATRSVLEDGKLP